LSRIPTHDGVESRSYRKGRKRVRLHERLSLDIDGLQGPPECRLTTQILEVAPNATDVFQIAAKRVRDVVRKRCLGHCERLVISHNEKIDETADRNGLAPQLLINRPVTEPKL